jgi:putative ABC transport system ATP-binding protein
MSAPPALQRSAPRSATRLVLRTLTRRRWAVLRSYALLTVWQLCEVLVPVMIGVVIEQGVARSDVPAMLGWLGLLAVLFTVLSMSYRVAARTGVRVEQEEVHDMRLEVARHALDPRGLRDEPPAGETLSLATSDVEQVALLVRATGYTLAALAGVAVTAWILLRTDPLLGVVVLVGVPVVVTLSQAVVPLIARRSRHAQTAVAEATGVATDLVRGLRVLKGVGAEDAAARRFRRHSAAAAGAAIRTADSRGAMTGLTTGLSALLLAVVALLAGRLAVRGEIGVGELVAVVGLTQFLAEPIGALGELGAFAAQAHASARRVVHQLSGAPLATQGSSQARAGVDGVSVTVAGDGVTIASRPGELLAVVVDDPALAGSLVRHLAGEVAEPTMRVLVDGTPLEELTVPGRRELLTVAPHHADLFEGTLRENVDPHGRTDAASLAAVLAATSADEVVALSDEGLDQPVTAGGSTLSGGQRQRVALARALASGAPALVLHDPTTAVDAVTEQRIGEGVRRLRHGPGSPCTTWLVASTPGLLAYADRVVVVRGGRVVAEGAHVELSDDADYREQVLR